VIIDNNNPNYRINTEFFTQDELKNVKNYLNSRTEAQWEQNFIDHYPKQEDVSSNVWASLQGWKGMAIDVSSEEMFSATLEKAKKEVEDRFNAKVFLEQSLLNRWRVGREQLPHIDYILDHEENDQKVVDQYQATDPLFFENFKENFKTKNFSTLIYLNSDFVGGELFFPQYDDLKIKPEENLAICFKGDTNHLHGVKMITEGIRYTIAIFWTEE
jgi:hypothetical protein